MGGDALLICLVVLKILFQSTPPVWVVTYFLYNSSWHHTDFNPHHPCGWWLALDRLFNDINTISIHTTRVGGDMSTIATKMIYLWFQSTPPVWVVTAYCSNICVSSCEFQSTPPVWVVTQCYTYQMLHYWFQSTPPVWVVTMRDVLIIIQRVISIHTTRVGGDIASFLTTSNFFFISIHTTRVGGDNFITKLI